MNICNLEEKIVLTVKIDFKEELLSSEDPMLRDFSIMLRKGEIEFSLKGKGIATIDWGDGTIEDRELSWSVIYEVDGKEYESDHEISLEHKYAKAAEYTITITGKILELECPNINLTNIDLSNSHSLIKLDCSGNRLLNLNVNSNKTLIIKT